MTAYEIALFLHIVAVLGMFGGIGTSLGVVQLVRRAPDVTSVRALMSLGAPAGKTIPILAIIALITGIYMVEDAWDWDRAWIYISVVALVILLAMGFLVNEARMKAIGEEAGGAPDGEIPASLRKKLDDPVLQTSEITMTLATLGIVYLMVLKPGVGESLLALGISVALGLAISAPGFKQR